MAGREKFTRFGVLLPACFILVVAGCSTAGSVLPRYGYSDITPPPQPLSINYQYSYVNHGPVGSFGTFMFRQEIEKIFAQSGIITEDKKGLPVDFRMTLLFEETTYDTMFGALLTGITLTLIPGPVEKYDYKLVVILRRGEEIIKSYTYHDYSRLWFGLFCLPALFMDQPHAVARGVVDNMLLNLVHDLQKDGLLKPADVHPPKTDINSDLRSAAQKGNLKEVISLLGKGADVNSKNMNGSFALMMAALNNHPEVVKYLLSQGADINARDNHEYTTLIHLAGHGDIKILKLLLESGADVNAKNDLGLTALDVAESFQHSDVVNLLKKYRAQHGER